MRALTFSRFGGPEVLVYREVPDPEVLPGHALVRMQAIGLNFADVYRRRRRSVARADRTEVGRARLCSGIGGGQAGGGGKVLLMPG